jgi:hypothetical protein
MNIDIFRGCQRSLFKEAEYNSVHMVKKGNEENKKSIIVDMMQQE